MISKGRTLSWQSAREISCPRERVWTGDTYLSITSVQWSPWVTQAVTLWDTQGCSPMLAQLWIHLSVRQWFSADLCPFFQLCYQSPSLSLAFEQLTSMESASIEEHSRIPHFSCEHNSCMNTKFVFVQQVGSAWRVQCLVSTFFHAGPQGSLVAGTGMLPTYGSQLMRPALPKLNKHLQRMPSIL